jgi:hypothetical protein
VIRHVVVFWWREWVEAEQVQTARDGNGDLAVTAHQALVRDRLTPILADRVAVQFTW